MSKQQRRAKLPRMFLRADTFYFRKTTIDPVTGIKRRVSISTGQKDKALAITAAIEIESRMNKGELETFIGKKKRDTKPRPTYAAFAQTFQDEVSIHKVVPSKDENVLAPSIAFLGSKLLTDITATDCEGFSRYARALVCPATKRLYRPNTVRNFIAASSMLFREAIRRKLMTQDPWADMNTAARRRAVPTATRRERVVSPAEQEAFLKAADAETARAAIILFGTGIRESELLALEASHCDFANNDLRLTWGIVKGKTKHEKDSKELARVVPMNATVAWALKTQLQGRRDGTVGCGHKRRESPKLFNISATNLGMHFTNVFAAAEIKPFTQHDCRRTFATRCAEQGVKPHRLQAWLGHTNITTTMSYYVFEQRDAGRAEMQHLNLGMPAAPISIEAGRKSGSA